MSRKNCRVSTISPAIFPCQGLFLTVSELIQSATWAKTKLRLLIKLALSDSTNCNNTTTT